MSGASGPRARFRDWRRSRPFWGGLWTLLSGLEIVYLPLSPVSDLVAAGVVGAQSILVGFLIIVMGVFVWFSPSNRMLAGILTLVFAVSSLVLSNLGGLVVGMLLGVLGGALTVSWTDRPRRVPHFPAPEEHGTPAVSADLATLADPPDPTDPATDAAPAAGTADREEGAEPARGDPAEREVGPGWRPSPRPRSQSFRAHRPGAAAVVLTALLALPT
ncbi:MAG TPA: DUF6114 domain-containing protein, partial [Pseudonocardiaceae bacterium]